MSKTNREYELGTNFMKSGVASRCFLCDRPFSRPGLSFRETVSGDWICEKCDRECDEEEEKQKAGEHNG